MGRYYWSSKTEADGLLKISIYWLRKNGYLFANCLKGGVITWTNRSSGNKNSISIQVSTLREDSYARLIYTITDYSTGKKKDLDYKILLVTSPCYFGGSRYWFKCSLSRNGVYCGRKVAILYKDGDFFGCRHCHDLSYSSRNESHHGIFSLLGRLYSVEEKISQLRSEIKRYHYAGKPTKKARRLMKLTAIDTSGISMLEENVYRG